MAAPIMSSGSMILFIGRKLNESSPDSSEVKVLPARIPASIRMVEPLFPQSRGSCGACNAFGGSIVTGNTRDSNQDARILVFTAPRELDYLTRQLPDPGPDDVLVQTLYSGISHGTEMNVYRGLAPQWKKRYDRELRLFLPADDGDATTPPEHGYWTAADTHWGYPLAYGYANVGRVIAAGSQVEHVHEGDLVYAYQPHQTAYVAPAASVIPLPELANRQPHLVIRIARELYGNDRLSHT